MFKTISQTNDHDVLSDTVVATNTEPEDNFDVSSYSDDVFFDASNDDSGVDAVSDTVAATSENIPPYCAHITKINVELANQESYAGKPDVWTLKTPDLSKLVGDHNLFFETIFRTTNYISDDDFIPASLVAGFNNSLKAEILEDLCCCGQKNKHYCKN